MADWENKTNEELVLEWQQSNDNDLFEYIFNRNRGFICSQINHALNKYKRQTDNIIQCARIAVWKAAKHYKPGYKFITYLSNIIPKYILENMKENYNVKLPHNIWCSKGTTKADACKLLISTYSVEDTEFGQLSDILEDENINIEADYEREERNKHIISLLTKLTPAEQKYITMYFGLDGNNPMTYSDVARKMNVSRNAVNYSVLKGLKKLKGIIHYDKTEHPEYWL